MVREGLRSATSIGGRTRFHKSWNRPTPKCPLAPGYMLSTPLVERQKHLRVAGGFLGMGVGVYDKSLFADNKND